jgi:2-oxoglutarate dehydrogenase E2 component (dihydrolipoamide succinyltransferase)
MSERVTMPALGESVTEGTVTRWLKSVGDTVQVDEPLLEVSTDKVDTEIPSPVSGVLQEILVGEDETVPVGADLAVVGDGAAGSSDEGGQQQDQAPQGSSQESQPEQQEQAQEQAPQRDEQPDERGQAQQEQSQQEQAQQPPAEPDQSTRQPQQAQASGDDGGTPVTMPALGESVTEGTVTRWLKAEGDTVEVDEPLLEVSTDKVDTEIPSPVSGTVLRILVREDETVPVGADLALVGTGSGAATAPAAQEQPQQQGRGGDDLGDAAADAAAADGQSEAASSPAAQLEQASEQREASHEAAPPAPAADAQQQVQSAPEQSRPEHESQPQQSEPQQDRRESPQQAQDASAYVTPLVRKLASEHGVDLTSLTGTGVGGRIRKQDVLDAARARQEQEKPAAAGAPSGSPSVAASVSAKRGTTEKMTRLRRLIAQRMVESLQTSAQLTTVVEVDLTKKARLRDSAKR